MHRKDRESSSLHTEEITASYSNLGRGFHIDTNVILHQETYILGLISKIKDSPACEVGLPLPPEA